MQAEVAKKKTPAIRWLAPLAAAAVIGLWLVNTPHGLLGKADGVAYSVCHRIAERSFLMGGRALPLCARCSGMYLGITTAWVFYSLTSRRRGGFPRRGYLALLGLFGLAWALDGLNSFLTLIPGAPYVYNPSNLGRLLTGTLMGVAMMSIVFPMFNQVAWADWAPEPALSSSKKLGGLLLAAVAVSGLALTGNPLLLYPLALVSAAGVLLLLTVIYATMILNFWRANQARSWRELWLPLTMGLVMAFLQIGLLDLARYQLTGTWAGIAL